MRIVHSPEKSEYALDGLLWDLFVAEESPGLGIPITTIVQTSNGRSKSPQQRKSPASNSD